MDLPPADEGEDRIGATGVEVTGPEDLEGMIVTAEILEYPDRGEAPVGRVIEIIGAPEAFGVDVEIVIRKYHIPHRFPPEVLEHAEKAPDSIGKRDLRGRRDFREASVVTIDGESARDFDDAVWVDRLDNGNFALQVHIADVSHYVQPGTPIDLEAGARGTSVYFPDRAVPMLPLELSTGICSLKPGVDRLTLSALLEINHRGGVVSQEFCRGVIHSAERMTYTAVHQLLSGDEPLRERYAPLLEGFERMRDLAVILTRKRQRRGAIDFDLPEPLIEFDEFGEMAGVTRGPRNIAHRLIEEFMLAANEAVASHLQTAGLDAIYRIHEEPDPKKVLEFEQLASQFGLSLGVRSLHRSAKDIKITPRHYQKLV
ncbi:MAG: RNB domain-containing ribonuclease, partial [bacterium]|nr:RNB domain-containing ribonuclease [bacterium]